MYADACRLVAPNYDMRFGVGIDVGIGVGVDVDHFRRSLYIGREGLGMLAARSRVVLCGSVCRIGLAHQIIVRGD